MGTSHRGEMLLGTQVGLPRKTCSRSPLSGLGAQRLWAPNHLAPPCAELERQEGDGGP